MTHTLGVRRLAIKPAATRLRCPNRIAAERRAPCAQSQAPAMPVLGHAFVGLATAMTVRPSRQAVLGAALWTPVLVGLAYLPDIAAQAGLLLGLSEPRIATHSVLAAVVASAIVAMPLAWLAGISARRAFLIALVSI